MKRAIFYAIEQFCISWKMNLSRIIHLVYSCAILFVAVVNTLPVLPEIQQMISILLFVWTEGQNDFVMIIVLVVIHYLFLFRSFLFPVYRCSLYIPGGCMILQDTNKLKIHVDFVTHRYPSLFGLTQLNSPPFK